MSQKKNVHGLARYIPPAIKQKIRKDAGFGCIFCGAAFVQYEHIDPEYKDAKEHNPDDMTILCASHHDMTTRGRLSKLKIKKQKQNPFAKKSRAVTDQLFPDLENLGIMLGNSSFKNIGLILSFYGKPIFWFENLDGIGSPLTLCSIFVDNNGKKIGFINRNEYISLVDDNVIDIVSDAKGIKVYGSIDSHLLLDLEVKGDLPLKVKYFESEVYGLKIICDDEALYFGPKENLSAFSSVSVTGGGLSSSGITYNRPIEYTPKDNKVMVLIKLASRSKSVLNLEGNKVGWLIDEKYFNFSGNVVGIRKKNSVYNVVGEYIGESVEDKVLMYRDEYDDREPIYVSSNNRSAFNVFKISAFDVSFRLFKN